MNQVRARGEGHTVNLAATFHQNPSWIASLQVSVTQHKSSCQCYLGAHNAPISAGCIGKGIQAAGSGNAEGLVHLMHLIARPTPLSRIPRMTPQEMMTMMG